MGTHGSNCIVQKGTALRCLFCILGKLNKILQGTVN